MEGLRGGALARPIGVTSPALRHDDRAATAAGAPVPQTAAAAARARVLLALLILGATAFFGWYVLGVLAAIGLDRPLNGSSNAFFRLFSLTEPAGLAVLAAFAFATLVALRAAPGEMDGPLARLVPRTAPGGRALALVALAVVALTWTGTSLVMHRFALSMDEYNASFQAAIIVEGGMSAPVPPAWRKWVGAMLPIFTTYRDGAWFSTYLPGYATLRAIFLAAGAEWLANPVLAAVSVLLLALVARRLWPGEARRPWLAIAFLALGSQFLIMSMTAYAMPAHLAVNLLWFWLYLRDDRASLALLPLVGVIALGLHNPFPHALFVAPFLLRMLQRKRFAALAWIGAIYLAGAAFWLARLRAGGTAAGGGSFIALFEVPGTIMMYVQGMSLALTFTWQTPVAALCVLVALLGWRDLDEHVRDLALGLCATFGFYFFFASHQGHGWGYRYLYGVLGNLALVAAAGVPLLARAAGARVAGRLVAASLLVSLLVQLPLRSMQAERFVRPFAAASAWVQSRPESAVLVPTMDVWYAQDLVRNDPHFRPGPRVMVAAPFTPAILDELRREMPLGVHVITAGELVALGMHPVEWAR